MKEFRRTEDVERARLPGGLSHIVRGTLQKPIDAYAEVGEAFAPEADGYAVFVEQGDTDEGHPGGHRRLHAQGRAL